MNTKLETNKVPAGYIGIGVAAGVLKMDAKTADLRFLTNRLRGLLILAEFSAELIGKRHDYVLRAMRNMEPAWVKVSGRNLDVLTFEDIRPVYELTKNGMTFLYLSI
jgi:hypothetical protein